MLFIIVFNETIIFVFAILLCEQLSGIAPIICLHNIIANGSFTVR
jgi:hypothetical protein